MSTPTQHSDLLCLTSLMNELETALRPKVAPSMVPKIKATLKVVTTVMKEEGAQSALILLIYSLIELASCDDGSVISEDG